ncbi:MAG: hypothetical protein EXS24_01175 [Pedosphaera sp.]|nr:hypothetical protein [Pedosphaera sp.]
MRKQLFAVLILGFSTLISGCVTSYDGDVKMSMTPWGTDALTRRYDKPVADVTEAVKKALAHHGIVTKDNGVSGVITGRVDTRYVNVKVTKVEEIVTQVSVQVRTKWRNSDLSVASEILEQVALNLVK